jgi:hypothetical protein
MLEANQYQRDVRLYIECEILQLSDYIVTG